MEMLRIIAILLVIELFMWGVIKEYMLLKMELQQNYSLNITTGNTSLKQVMGLFM